MYWSQLRPMGVVLQIDYSVIIEHAKVIVADNGLSDGKSCTLFPFYSLTLPPLTLLSSPLSPLILPPSSHSHHTHQGQGGGGGASSGHSGHHCVRVDGLLPLLREHARDSHLCQGQVAGRLH